MKKIGNIAVAVGSYTDKNNSKKALWEQVGSLLENEKGTAISQYQKDIQSCWCSTSRKRLKRSGSHARRVP